MPLSNSQYESIRRKYEKLQTENRLLAEQRREQVLRDCPELSDIENQISACCVRQSKLLLSGDQTAPEQLHNELEELRGRRSKLLASAGYCSDYLDPIYSCPFCKDTGYVSLSGSPAGGPPYEKCRCFQAQELTLLYEQSNIQAILSRENFSTLSYEYYQGEDLERFRKAVDICKNFIQNFKQDYHNLLFYGTVGTGKSFLSGCVADELLKGGNSVIYFSASGLFDTLARYAFDSKEKESLRQFYEDIYNCDLLILDDLGTELTNSFVASQLFSCLNERALRKKPVIISTNLGLEEIRDRYSDRVFSRITSNYTICKLSGPDIRMRKKVRNI